MSPSTTGTNTKHFSYFHGLVLILLFDFYVWFKHIFISDRTTVQTHFKSSREYCHGASSSPLPYSSECKYISYSKNLLQFKMYKCKPYCFIDEQSFCKSATLNIFNSSILSDSQMQKCSHIWMHIWVKSPINIVS